jgi:hypothetical protein
MGLIRTGWKYICCCLVLAVLLTACSEQRRTTVKNYPKDVPFVFYNEVNVQGPSKKDEKKRLAKALQNHWDDSLQSRRIQQFGIFYVIKNPAVFDSNNISRTFAYMQSYLRSQGYYGATFTYNVTVDTFKTQLRTSISIQASTGPNTVIDSVAYAIADTALQQLAMQASATSFLRKGTPFSKEVVAAELDRLVNIYRKAGYFKITRDNFYAEVDTLDANLLNLSADPFEQALRITEAAIKRKEQPTIDVTIKQRSVGLNADITDTTTVKQYYIGNVYYYPETKSYEIFDSLIGKPFPIVAERRNFTVYEKSGAFHYKTLREYTYFKRGSLYNEDEFYRTLNNLGSIGAWQQVDGRPTFRGDSVDIHIFLIPALRQGYSFDFETSRNTGDFLGSNLLGVALNASYRHRNVARRAIQMNTFLRNGVELGLGNANNTTGNFLQTLQSSFGLTFYFPRFITPFNVKSRNKFDGTRTFFNIGAVYTDRREFYRLRSFNAGWGYEWRVKNRVWKYQPFNAEIYLLDTLQLLRNAFVENPFLRTAFNTGTVLSQNLSVTLALNNPRRPNNTSSLRFAVEEAGGIFGLIPDLTQNIYRYLKFEAEYRKLIAFSKKHQLAGRFLGGVGYNYNTVDDKSKVLPFFKQFVAGGPNSMRAWGLRQLGLGSSLLSDTSSTFRDRFGDVQLEANVEYRFTIAEIGGVKIGSALFADVGNIWNLQATAANPKSEINIRRLWRDLAIATGTSIRLDFDYFLIRLDFALKMKDPARLSNNGWLSLKDFTWRNTEFDLPGRAVRNNYAFQLGIGLPF